MRAALYARFSTDKQSSTADQLRVCERLAERHGFEVVARFTDEGLSGGTANRPGYQALLAAARGGVIEVIVAEDASRLWRNMAEQSPREAELKDLGVAIVTQDLDTRNEASSWLGPILGTAATVYRQEIGRRVRRSLEGRAKDCRPTGGRAYGYTSVREIVPAQAAVVREVFERFAAGETLMAIAADLNARGVPSPGASWSRKSRRKDGVWLVSALHVMLKNDVYIGRVVWNRRRWVRSAVDSSKRRAVMNPPSEWIVHDVPELRIVDDSTWQRVARRLTERRDFYKPGPGGRSMYLLSGLLRCALCGAAMVIAAHRPVRYQCSTNRHGGPAACGNGLTVRKDVAEAALVEPVLEQVLSPAAVEHAVRFMRQLAADDAKPVPPAELGLIDEQLAELARLVDAGTLARETAAPARQALYVRRQDLLSRARTTNVRQGLFGAEEDYRETAAAMREVLAGDDVLTGREVLRELVGEIPLRPEGNVLWAELNTRPLAIAAAGGVNWNGSGGEISNGLRVALPAGGWYGEAVK